jgi:hypothetical protein
VSRYSDANSVSTVPVVKATLVDLLKAEQGLAGVQVDYSDPGINQLQREHVFLGDVGQVDEEWAPFGHLARDEQYALELFVHVAQPGADQQTVTERVYELFGVINQMMRPLARTSTVLAPGVYGCAVRPLGHKEFIVDQGRAAFLPGQFAIKARI